MKLNYFSGSFLALILLASCQKDDAGGSSFAVNEEASKVEWKGSATDHFHVGYFRVKGDVMTNKGGVVTGGSFIIPISSIQNYDLPEGPKEQLLEHLKSPDFFNVAVHPNAEFKITAVAPYRGGEPTAVEGANYLITGEFSMIGQMHPISFPGKITLQGNTLSTHAKFKIDRLKWGMTSFNDPTQPLYLLPDVEIELSIESVRKE